MKILLALALGLAAGAARGQEVNCRACHTSDSPTKQKPALVKCPRGAAKAPRAASESPRSLTLGEPGGAYGPVKFSHQAHAGMSEMGAGGCYRCHHYDRGGRIQRCGECHSAARARADLGKPDLKGAIHRLCVDCHREWSGSTGCAGCHGDKTAPARHGGKAAGWISNRFHGRLACGACHTSPGQFAKLDKGCESCHPKWAAKFDHEKTGLVLNETHAALACADCHGAPFSAAPVCGTCHDKTYPKDVPGKR